jgi:hypothetical protein
VGREVGSPMEQKHYFGGSANHFTSCTPQCSLWVFHLFQKWEKNVANVFIPMVRTQPALLMTLTVLISTLPEDSGLAL